MPSRVAIVRARSKSIRDVVGRCINRSASMVARRGNTRKSVDCDRSARSASVTVSPSVESLAGLAKSTRMIWSPAPSFPAPSSDPAGPMPNARSTIQPTTSTTKAPTATAPPIHVRFHDTWGLALSAIVCSVPDGAADVPPGVKAGVAVYERCATRCTHAVNAMIGSPASITPNDPGSTQSGSPITVVAAHAVRAISALATAHNPSALPMGIRPARIPGAATAAPLDVTVSSTRTRSPACWGRAAGSFSSDCITSAASDSGVSARSSRTSRGFSPR